MCRWHLLQADEEHESEELSMRNFLGLWLVLVVGCALGIVLSCCDLAWAASRRARAEGGRFHTHFWSELRFVFRFEQSVKPLRVRYRLAVRAAYASRGTASCATHVLQGPLSGSSSESPDTARSVEEPAEADGAARDADEAGSLEAEARARSGSGAAAGPRRRRSSMHAASLRLARHTNRDSATPAHR